MIFDVVSIVNNTIPRFFYITNSLIKNLDLIEVKITGETNP